VGTSYFDIFRFKRFRRFWNNTKAHATCHLSKGWGGDNPHGLSFSVLTDCLIVFAVHSRSGKVSLEAFGFIKGIDCIPQHCFCKDRTIDRKDHSWREKVFSRSAIFHPLLRLTLGATDGVTGELCATTITDVTTVTTVTLSPRSPLLRGGALTNSNYQSVCLEIFRRISSYQFEQYYSFNFGYLEIFSSNLWKCWNFSVFPEFRHNFQNFTKDSTKILKIVQFFSDFHHKISPNYGFPQEINWYSLSEEICLDSTIFNSDHTLFSLGTGVQISHLHVSSWGKTEIFNFITHSILLGDLTLKFPTSVHPISSL
jgi:hypothetical protein